jgi:hypothetical protein
VVRSIIGRDDLARASAAVVMLTLCGSLAACGSGQVEQASSSTAAAAPASTSASVPGPAPVALKSTKAVRAARRACEGRRPAGVIKAYLPAARRRGLDGSVERIARRVPKRLVGKPPHALLAGAVYAGSLPVKERAGAAPSCAQELMDGMRVSAAKKKSMSNEGTSR